MILHSLGHSEALIEVTDANGKPYRLLSDAWLSRYSASDFMERNPPISVDSRQFPVVDGVFVSHSHADHLDPYFLTELSERVRFELLLPETLEYLVPVFKAYLPNQDIRILRNLEPYSPRPGITVAGLIFENDSVGNEEDVMTLKVEDGTDCVYLEVDTLPPEIPEEREKLQKFLTDKPYRTVCYVATRNELEGNLKIHDIVAPNERRKFAKSYVEERTEWMEWQYAMFDEYEEEFEDFMRVKGFCRLFTGQGLRYPSVLSPELAAVNLLPLSKILEIENGLMKKYDRNFPQDVFEAGVSYEVSKGRTTRIGNVPGVTVHRLDVRVDDVGTVLPVKRVFKPLRDEERDKARQERIVLGFLNGRLLPSKCADPDDNLKNLVLRNADRTYRVLVRFGTSKNFETKTFAWNFSKIGFECEGVATGNVRFDEDYWANDLEDFFDGTQELYSNFLHKLDADKGYRLWTVLGNDFLNHDLVQKKFAFHFERAARGGTPEEFVLSAYGAEGYVPN